MPARPFGDVAEICVDLLFDCAADVHHARYVGMARVIIFFRHRARLETRSKLFGIIVSTPGHPAGRLHAMTQHVVIGVLFIMRPRVVAEHGIDLQESKQKDQPANQLVAGDVAHPMIAVVESEIALETEHAGLIGHLAFIT